MRFLGQRLNSVNPSVWAAAFIGLICFCVVGLSCWREWEGRARALRNAEVEMSNLARSLTQHVDDSLELLDASIIGLVNRLETYGFGPETISRVQKILADRKAEVPRVHGLVVCDENGDWLAASGPLGPNLGQREYFRHHKQFEARGAFVGRPVQSSTRDGWITTVSRRLNHRDGSFAGVVVATISSEYFSQFYRQFEIGTRGAITLLGADGLVMARYPDNGTYVGRDLSETRLFHDAALQSPNGVYFTKAGAVDGLQRVGAYARSSTFPVIVLTTNAQDDILAAWRDRGIVRLAIVLTMAASIALIGVLLVRQLRQRQSLMFALVANEADFRALAEGSSDMVTRIDLDGRLRYVSPSSESIVGWKSAQLTGKPALAGVEAEDLPKVNDAVAALKRGDVAEARISYRIRHRDAEVVWIESAMRITKSATTGKIDGIVAVSRDITSQKAIEQNLASLATLDGLTGIANRRRFDEVLEAEWKRGRREAASLSLLIVDVDNFKKFNDQYGHPAGDACLRSIAQVLAAETHRPADLAARYGGEEFVLLLPDTDAAGCRQIARRIRKRLAAIGIAHALNLPSRKVTVSIGGAIMSPRGGISSSSLVEAADRALYSAKGLGRDRLVMSGQKERQQETA